MALESLGQEPRGAAIVKRLPLWTNDIEVSDVGIITNTPAESTSESDTESEVLPRPARLDADNKILELLAADIDHAMRRWRNLYHQRVRCGTNKELWTFTRSIAAMAEPVLSEKEKGKFKGADADRTIRLLVTEHGLCSFLEIVVSQADFFAEYPVRHPSTHQRTAS